MPAVSFSQDVMGRTYFQCLLSPSKIQEIEESLAEEQNEKVHGVSKHFNW